MNKREVCEALDLLCEALDFSQDLQPGDELAPEEQLVLNAVRLGRTLKGRIERGEELQHRSGASLYDGPKLVIDWSEGDGG